MKSITTFIFMMPFLLLAQSKKELRTELLQKQAIIDSMQREVNTKDKTIDTLTQSFVKAQQNYSRQLDINQSIVRQYEHCQQQVSSLEKENNSLKNAKEPAKTAVKDNTSKASTKTPEDNAFGDVTNEENVQRRDISKQRYLIKQPNVKDILSDEDCTIAFIVSINQDGEVTGTPTVIQAQTTTTNTVLIQKVSALVKAEAKYNKDQGAPVVEKTIRIILKAQK